MWNTSKMQMEYQLIDFAKKGDILNIQRLIIEEEINPAAHNNQALWWAANRGHLDVLKLLLQDLRVSPAARKNAGVITAAENGHTAVVAFLLADERVNPSESGNLAVHSAARNGHFDVVALLIADERVDPSDANNTAIRRSSANGHMDIVQLLLAYASHIGNKKFDEVFQAAFNGFLGDVSEGAAEYLANKEKISVIAGNHAEIIRKDGIAACAHNIRTAQNHKKNYNNVAKISSAIEAKKAKDSIKKSLETEAVGWDVLSTVIANNANNGPKVGLTVVNS
jgi:ankyrin repeat protein